MHEDEDPPPGDTRRKPKIEGASALPTQLGQKLRDHFAEVESQPVPDRLRELLEALAAKEKKS
jgi:hypothetical protein